jgi:hypothetical protein
MAVAVVLRPDDSVAARVVAMWECLFIAGIEPALFLPGSEPRMPLAVYPDDVAIARIDAALGHLNRSFTAMQVDITGIGIFGGLLPILSLTVAPTTGLLVIHEQVHTMLADLPSAASYRPGYWTPRIVVSEHAISVTAAIWLLLPKLLQPITGTLVAVELVQLPSGTVFSCRDL